MKTEVIKPQDFGIETKQAKELMSNLPQIKEEREVLEKQYKDVVKLDIENPDSWKKARELRLLIQKNRTQGINVWHRNAKDYFLKGGQFVDAIKRKESAVNERMEAQLLEIEKYEEIQRQKEIARLNELRIAETEKYKEYIPYGINLGELEEESYNHLLRGAKLQFKEEQERIKKEEEERLEAERIEKLHTERKDLLIDVWQFVGLKDANFGEMSDEDFEQVLVNAEAAKKDHEEYENLKWRRSEEVRPYYNWLEKRLEGRKLADIDEEEYEVLKSELSKDKASHDKEQERIRKENERLEKERKALEAERKKEREEAEKKQKALEEKSQKEREKREKIESKLKAEQENKKRLAKEEEERVQKELNKNDSEKVKDLISDLENLKGKYKFKSKKNIKMYEDVSVLIQKVINHINK